MKIPLLDLKAQYAEIRDPVEQAIAEVCESQHFILGPKVAELEEAVANYTDTAHAIGVSSGTDALLLGLMALEVGAGDEVITTAFSFFATAGVVARLGATPVFCDIEPSTFNIDVAAVRRFLENECEFRDGKTINRSSGNTVSVIMPVHLFGQTADMAELLGLAKEFTLRIVEDAAQAIGARDEHGRAAGSIGDIGCFSFFPSKNLGAFGDAGMCVTSDPELAERMRILRVHGGKPKYYHALIGGNFRLDALQAAVLLVKLDRLESWTDARIKNADHYDQRYEAIRDSVVRPVRKAGARHIFNQYTIRVAERDGLRTHLAESGIATEIYYPVPLHLQQCFSHLGYGPGDLPHAEEAARSVLSLPVYPELSEAQLDHVAGSVAAFVEQPE